jgi:hypothetical protein
VIQVNETKGWLLAVRLSLCEEKKGSRISTWTQAVKNALGQRVHPGADLWLVRHVTGLFRA